MTAKLLSLALVGVLAAGLASADTSKMGNAGAQELRIPVGARGAAMAGSVVGDVGGAEGIFWNPAGVCNTEGTEALLSYSGYIADMTVSYVGVVSKMSFGTIGVSAKILSLGDLVVTTEQDWNGTGEVYSMNIPVLGLTYSNNLTDRVRFGTSLLYISEQILETSARGVAFDFGFQYEPGWRSLKLGMVMKNYGPRLKYSGADLERSVGVPGDDPEAANRTLALTSADFELPSSFQIGGSYNLDMGENGKVAFGFVFQSNNFSEDEYRLGAEYSLSEAIYVRGGYVICDQDEYLYGPSLGIGANFSLGRARASIEYSHMFVENYFDDIPELALKFGI